MIELRQAVGVAVWLGASTITPAPALAAAADEEPPTQTAPTVASSKLRSHEDGWLDFSGFLDKAYGFIPVLVPITEPAVGYGAAGGLTFIDKPPGEAAAGFGRPNITLVGGLATENDTWGLMAGDLRHWNDDRLQTLVGVIKASVNLDFYGIGEDSMLNDDPLRYALDPLGGAVRAKVRLGQSSRLWAGLSYALVDTRVEFEDPAGTLGLPDSSSDSRVGGVTPSLTYDSRDSMFTANKGTFAEGSVGLFDEALGSDESFQRVSLTLMHFHPIGSQVTLGVRGGATFSFGDVPFYLKPYISLRGAPILRYQGDEAAEVETEARWQFWKRFSLVGFAGYGAAWNDFEQFDDKITLVTGGTGFRYELARKYGIHAGLDVAFGSDHPIIYLQIGSAWARP